MFLEWLRASAEWKGWGMNFLTISAIITIAFSIAQMWGLLKQSQTIRLTGSGKSISVRLFAYWVCLNLCWGYYGIIRPSVTMALNGVAAIFYLLVVIALWKVKDITIKQRAYVRIFPLLFVALVLLPWKETLMTVILAGVILPFSFQYREIWKEKSLGALDRRLIVVLLTSMLFNTIYGYSTFNVAIMIVNPIALTAFLILAVRLLDHHESEKKIVVVQQEVVVQIEEVTVA